MMRKAKGTWQDYKTNEDVLSELKISRVAKKIPTYRNTWIQPSVNKQTKTVTFKTEISTMWETKLRTVPQKLKLLMRPEQVTRPKTL